MKKKFLSFLLCASLVPMLPYPVEMPTVVNAAEVQPVETTKKWELNNSSIEVDIANKTITVKGPGYAFGAFNKTNDVTQLQEAVTWIKENAPNVEFDVTISGLGEIGNSVPMFDAANSGSYGNIRIRKLQISFATSGGIIAANAFRNQKSMTEVNITNCRTINNEAFTGCSAIETISLGTDLQTIGDSAFLGVGADSAAGIDLEIPDTVRSIGASAFSLGKFKAIRSNNKVISMTIGDAAFQPPVGSTGIDCVIEICKDLGDASQNNSALLNYFKAATQQKQFAAAYNSATLNGVAMSEDAVGYVVFFYTQDISSNSPDSVDRYSLHSTASTDTSGELAEPTVETPTGWQIAGWYTDKLGTGTKWNFGTDKVTSGISLYAKYVKAGTSTPDTETVEVKFVCDSDMMSDGVETVEKGTKLTIPTKYMAENMKKTGYKFKGWFTTADGNTAFNFDGNINADTVAYAQWTKDDDHTAGDDEPSQDKPLVPTGQIEYGVGLHDGEAYLYYDPSAKKASLIGNDISNLEVGDLMPGYTQNSLASSFVNTLNQQKVTGVELVTPQSFNTAAKATKQSTLQSIGDGLLEGNTFLKTVTLTAPTLVFVGDSAFEDSTRLETVNITGNVNFDYIGERAFAANPKLKNVTIDSVSSIHYQAFADNESLTKVNLTGVDTIEAGAFQNATSLTSIVLPDGITEIDSNTFSGCTSLQSVTIPSSVKTIKEGAFADTAVTEIIGASGVKTVAAGAFTTTADEITMTLPTNAPKVLMNYNWTGSGYADLNVGGEGTYLVRFVTDHGSIDPLSMSAGATIDLSAEKYQLKSAGSTFDGWYYDAAYKNAATSSKDKPITIEGNTTFYAKWHKDNLTVTFDSQNGAASYTETVPYNTKMKQPAKPAKSGQVFRGWFTDTTYATQWNFNKNVMEDMTLYAKWSDPDIYTVTFDVDGGSAVESQEVEQDSYATQPENPTKQDYTFDDWYADAEYKTKFKFSSTKIKGDTTIYAHFLSDNVVVTFNTNGGSQITAQSVKRNSKGTAPANPTKENAEFLGWFKDEGLTQQFFFESNTVTDNMTLYAKWNQTAYTVKFVSNGGSAMDAVTTEPDSLIAKPIDPVKEGYYLAAWCKDSGLTTAWNFDADKVSADMTLYALWAPGKPEDNTYSDASGTGVKAPQTGDRNPFGFLWEFFK